MGHTDVGRQRGLAWAAAGDGCPPVATARRRAARCLRREMPFGINLAYKA